MKMPATGSTVTVEGYGTGLFVKGPNMDNDEPEVWMKFWDGESDTIVPIPLDEFREKRVYPEQQPNTDVEHDWDAVVDDLPDR